MPFLSPLRYPGGKGRLGPWLGELLVHNDLTNGWYVEPYAGGAGAALYLLLHDYVQHIVINDLDPAVYAFWWSVLNWTDELLRRIVETPVTVETWNRQRTVLANVTGHSPVDVGFAAFFLNRCNRSGILSGGVIGGKHQTGTHRLDARFNKKELCHRIERIAERRDSITVLNMDARELLCRLDPSFPERTVYYLDPPYYRKGSLLYQNSYTHDDHAQLAALVTRLAKPWLVTYNDCPQVRSFYADRPAVSFSMYYSTHKGRPRVTEVLFYGNLAIHKPPWLRR